MKKGICLSLAILVAIPASSCATHIPANGFHGSDYPYLTEGEKFGVRIGMEDAQARAALKNRPMTGFMETRPCGEEKFADKCPPGALVDEFFANGNIRYGGIYIIIVNGKVYAISWDFKLGEIFA